MQSYARTFPVGAHLVRIRWSAFLWLLLFPVTSSAAPVTYSFSGSGGLVGGFILDDAAAFELTTTPPNSYNETITGGQLAASELHMLWGSYGGYTFTGTPTLHVSDGTDPIYDFWIIRAPLASTPQTPLAPVWLNLFVYSGYSGVSLTPPSISNPNQFNFQYTIAFADGSFTGAQLQTLVRTSDDAVSVSEPTSLVLSVIGLLALVVRRTMLARA